jgi:hypothetical protein
MAVSFLWTALLQCILVLRAVPGVAPILDFLVALHHSAMGKAIENVVVKKVEETLIANGISDVAAEVQAAYETVKDL